MSGLAEQPACFFLYCGLERLSQLVGSGAAGAFSFNLKERARPLPSAALGCRTKHHGRPQGQPIRPRILYARCSRNGRRENLNRLASPGRVAVQRHRKRLGDRCRKGSAAGCTDISAAGASRHDHFVPPGVAAATSTGAGSTGAGSALRLNRCFFHGLLRRERFYRGSDWVLSI